MGAHHLTQPDPSSPAKKTFLKMTGAPHPAQTLDLTSLQKARNTTHTTNHHPSPLGPAAHNGDGIKDYKRSYGYPPPDALTHSRENMSFFAGPVLSSKQSFRPATKGKSA